jgi:predicted metal-dependent hydrolase
MGHHILPGNPPVELILRRSPRARRISLRVSRLDGRVTLTLPRGVREGEALDFARTKESWLRAQLATQPDSISVSEGVRLPIEGRPRLIQRGPGKRIVLDAQSITLPGPPEHMPARLQAWLKTLARERLAQASDRHAQALGRPYARLSLRDTRSRWGSCTSAGGLMYSWRLVMAPPVVLDYVAAHEVAHLAEMNHSPAFWAVVARLCPGYHAPRQWLRQHGTDLHRYRFDG